MASQKTILKALAGETQQTPPIWMMRQAGRYLPEYRATRAEAGDFLSLCYNPDLATEVTLQPIRRYGFDGAILFADILLVPQALGADLWFVTGEGPRLSTITEQADFDKLGPADEVHETLNPIYQTVRNLSGALPSETTLIGFAGAPLDRRHLHDRRSRHARPGPAHALKSENRPLFEALMERITEATIHYLSAQIDAGAEVVKVFDSWAGSLKGQISRISPWPQPAASSRRSRKYIPASRLSLSRAKAATAISASTKRPAPIASPSTIRSAPNGPPNTCKRTAACRATSPRRTWSPVATHWCAKPATWSRRFAAARISSTSDMGSRPTPTPTTCN